MTEPHSGLRFDIYERIHLSDELSGIRELDEVELLPHIQIVEDKQQALLKGNLWLTGKYEGEDGEPNRTLEHFIPVEITLPYNRVNRMEDIRVEIENFDIDLLSARSLNVTGVLSLYGIEMSGAQQENWEERQEVVFLHSSDTAENEADLPEPSPAEPAAAPDRGFWGQPAAAVSDEASALPATEPAEPEEAQEEVISADSLEDSADFVQGEPEPKQEMVIAFGTKTGPDPFGKDLKSLLQPSDYRQDSGKPEEVPIVQEESPDSTPDGLEWKKLFLSAEHPETQFKTLRIVIVQKSETIEQIAQRYRVNQREIILYNRLGQQEVEEGQLLYIPEAVASASR